MYDFKDLEAIRPVLKTDILISTLGTTIRNAGSQEEFVRVDHDIPLEISKMAKEEGCKTMILVSSVGADSGSKYFYTRMKGLLEEAIKDLEFETFHIIRPSLLLGNRMDSVWENTCQSASWGLLRSWFPGNTGRYMPARSQISSSI